MYLFSVSSSFLQRHCHRLTVIARFHSTNTPIHVSGTGTPAFPFSRHTLDLQKHFIFLSSLLEATQQMTSALAVVPSPFLEGYSHIRAIVRLWGHHKAVRVDEGGLRDFRGCEAERFSEAASGGQRRLPRRGRGHRRDGPRQHVWGCGRGSSSDASSCTCKTSHSSSFLSDVAGCAMPTDDLLCEGSDGEKQSI